VGDADADARRGYNEEDVSKIVLRGEGRRRRTSAMGFSWSTHRVMGGCADTGCRSSAAGVDFADERLRAQRGE
jgi:hypothetical protein